MKVAVAPKTYTPDKKATAACQQKGRYPLKATTGRHSRPDNCGGRTNPPCRTLQRAHGLLRTIRDHKSNIEEVCWSLYGVRLQRSEEHVNKLYNPFGRKLDTVHLSHGTPGRTPEGERSMGRKPTSPKPGGECFYEQAGTDAHFSAFLGV